MEVDVDKSPDVKEPQDSATTPKTEKDEQQVNLEANEKVPGKINFMKNCAKAKKIKMFVGNKSLVKEETVKKESPDEVPSSIDQVDIIDGTTSESESCKVERLENELRISKELIQSLKVERKKLRSDKNDLLQQVKHLCASLQDKEQELRNFIRKFDQRLRESSESNVAKTSSDNDHDRWTLIKHAHDEAERSLALAAQLNVKDIQLKRMEQQLLEARRQLTGCISDQESVVSMAPIISPGAHGLMNHGCDDNELLPGGIYGHERGSCSADSGVRTSDRESAAGDLNLSDGACENDGLAIDSDSISLISSHHNMGQCKK